jgi:prephenate dehydratase
MKINTLGPEGSYHSLSALAHLPDYQIELCNSFDEVFMMVEKGELGWLAVKNSISGQVSENEKRILKGFKVIRKEKFQIDLALCTKSPIDVSNILQIHSHQKALEESSSFIAQFLNSPMLIAKESTALAAMQLQKNELPANAAVICHRDTAQHYGLYVIQDFIQNQDVNQTEFWLFELLSP